ncbi:MAG: hypothetical protein M1539_01910 [Actinobacteria bacterium]|nr:hypothetical protein [Actinomycetota bacterium]MCL5882725.1 hypothetical protein [Actinomycetota bacterium]
MIRRISILAVAMVVGLTAMIMIGCGSSETPSQVVEKYYKVIQDSNCEAVPDLVVSGRPKVLDNYVNSCKRYAGKLESYSIKGQGFAYGGGVAGVDTEVTLKDDNGGETTKSVQQVLTTTDDGWKLTILEDRD